MKHLKTMAVVVMAVITLKSEAQQKWFTRNGRINFFSKTTAENIDATNNEVFSLIDPVKNEVAFQVLNTGFKFDKALMQEHFNEDYMESSKFPKATFQGVIADPSKIDFNKDGEYSVVVDGTLTIHGTARKASIPATVRVQNGQVMATSKFSIRLADYNIKVPSIVSKQISEAVDVAVECKYDPYKR